jgi:hypothetical protein
MGAAGRRARPQNRVWRRRQRGRERQDRAPRPTPTEGRPRRRLRPRHYRRLFHTVTDSRRRRACAGRPGGRVRRLCGRVMAERRAGRLHPRNFTADGRPGRAGARSRCGKTLQGSPRPVPSGAARPPRPLPFARTRTHRSSLSTVRCPICADSGTNAARSETTLSAISGRRLPRHQVRRQCTPLEL